MDIEMEKFVEDITRGIRNYLPYPIGDYEIKTMEVSKFSKKYFGMCIRKHGSEIALCHNLTEAYADYIQGIPLRKILQEMAAAEMREDISEKKSLSISLKDYDEIKKRLFIKVYSAEHPSVQNFPHTLYGDMAIVYAADFSDVIQKEGASVMLSYDILKSYDITVEQLHQDALENTQKLFPLEVTTMEKKLGKELEKMAYEQGMNPDMLKEMMDYSWNEVPEMYVVGNKSSGGAGAIFCPGVMEQLSKFMQGGYYIFPSSIYEMIISPDDSLLENSDMSAIVNEANQNQLFEGEILSKHAYHYDDKTGKFEMVEEYQKRLENQKRLQSEKRRKPRQL